MTPKKAKQNHIIKLVLEKAELERLMSGVEILKIEPDLDLIFIVKPDPKPTYTEIILDKLGLNKLETKTPDGHPF